MLEPTPLLEFAALGLSQASLRALAQVGYEHPTPVQQQAIPPGLAGNDVIGCAATGTGKTAAFVLPLVERLHGKSGLRAVVLAPTRELALQISAHAQRFAAAHGLKIATLIGGVEIRAQVDELRGANLIVATPGRLVDHLRKATVAVTQVEVLVLDEADRMLDMGFKPQLTRILAKLPRNRQTFLFSATMAGEVAEFAKANLQAPVRVEVAPSGTTAERAQQCVFEVAQSEKTPLLLALLAEGDESTLVFTRTRRRADKLAKVLLRAGHRVVQIHADRSQAQRKYALDGFRSRRYRVLVATDVASRGIDVAEIGHVVNFDLPHSPEDYVHRVGRTARAEASGKASSFAGPDEGPQLREIEKFTRAALIRAEVPRDSAVFLKAIADDRARQADPGPRQPGAGQSSRPEGQAPGRHARTHPKKPSGVIKTP
jgi:ATP-dependent RNA helicase RhlE